uniref:Protein kinase domain-containing protein n=2 Tax=Aegilops tauschii subsp. strangulata TaxID=200361 RepID=A0A453GPH9_AEGTS|nr:wall-associated receptor kinase 3-like [Aegilops tauschii subsp. strangulata]
MGPGCFRDGFEVLCNQSYDPPRPFLADSRISNYVADSFPLLELLSISVATGEARVYASVSYRCSTNDTTAYSTEQGIKFYGTPFAVSATRNVLIGVGLRVDPELSYAPRGIVGDFPRLSCGARDYIGSLTATNDSCTGRGCCEATFPPGEVGPGKYFILRVGPKDPNRWWRTHPCIYGMLVEKSGYNFSTPDMEGDKTLPKRFPRGVPLALDFAAGNTSCPAQGEPDYACVSGNSSCANATYTDTTPGYFCKCWEGYAGNPYVTHGCQDIDECKLPQVYNCISGICKNELGGYDCPCKFGMEGDGKAGTCTDVFPLAAKVTVGAIGGILLMAVLSFLVILHKEKKKMEEFYRKNGGPILEQANTIKLFKKWDLKPILKNSNLIGKGCFGEVYKGLLDNKQVAIKKPINGSMQENDQFTNEVIIQSQVIHKNIVRLIGCCLEVDAPMLVYEFISQGSLHDILHDNNNKVALNLDARLSIAAQSADGLAYMHSQANTRILHGDVKPANILLDDNFAPKISDFGISRLLARDKEHTESVIGDMNYMDPVYLQEGILTEKSDVYSFGIVILELISSRRAIHSENNGLVKSFLQAHEKHKKATEFFDKEIAITEDLELLDNLAGMAMECLRPDVDQRPTMMEVAERLHKLSRSRKVQDVCH